MIHGLMSGMSTLEANGATFSFFSSEPIDEGAKADPVKYVVLPPRKPANRFLEETLFLSRFGDAFDSVLFPNYFTPPVRSRAKVVTVIHDLQYRHYPANFCRRKRAWLRCAQALTLRRADEVIAISEFVKRDIIRHHGGSFADKIRVIPNPVSWARLEAPCDEAEAELVPKAPYILTVAAHYAHKNLETLIRAFASVHRTHRDTTLVLTGQMPDRLIGVSRHARVDEWIRELGLEGAVQVTGHVSDALLGALYRSATMFVFPSLFEGFGMPPVEALGLGLPVVTTKCASLPEVTMGMARYVDDPLSADELAERMLEVLATPSAYLPTDEGRQKLRRAYSPETVARAYYSALA